MVALMHRTVEFERATRIGASYPQCFNQKNGSLRRLEICALGYSSHTWGGFILQNYVTYFCEFTPTTLGLYYELTCFPEVTSAGLPTTSSYKLSLGCYGIAFVGTALCFYTQGTFGRRAPFLLGYTFMTACLWTIGGMAFATGPGIKWGQAVSAFLPAPFLAENMF